MAAGKRKLSFEQAMDQLDTIVTAMESGEIGIEESIARYEEAMQLATHCRKILESAEQRIRKIQLDSTNELRISEFEAPHGAGADDEEDPDADGQ